MKYLSKFRCEFNNSISEEEMIQLIEDRDVQILQTRSFVDLNIWRMLNEIVFAVRDDIELRIYSGICEITDFSFLPMLGNVKRLSLDCLMDASSLEKISSLEKLASLTIGVFNLESFRFLELISDQIEELCLMGTRSKKPDLKYINRFTNLKKIYIEGHAKNIDNISSLIALEDVTLRSISTINIEFLAPLKNIRSLDIKLGGIQNFSAVEGKESIKYLELWQVRGLNDICFISSLEGLQNLFLQSLPNIQSLPSLQRLKKLRRISLHNMKGLKDFSSLGEAVGLEDFILVDGRNQDPSQLELLFTLQNFKRAVARFGSIGKILNLMQ